MSSVNTVEANVSGAQLHSAESSESSFERVLLFSIGLVLPLISLRREYTRWDVTASFAERVAPVDVLIVMSIIALAYSLRLKVHLRFVFYLYALVVSAIIGVAHTADVSQSLTEFVAVTTALLYMVVGYNIGSRAVLVRCLIAGVAAGVVLETIIVGLDFFLNANWFDPAFEGMARGTFRGKNQLGNYGFTAAGLLLTIGWSFYKRSLMRALVIVVGLLATLLPFISGRRGAMLALFVWGLAFVASGLRYLRIRGFTILLFIILGVGVLLWTQGKALANSLIGQYLIDGVLVVGSGTSFITLQVQSAFERIATWFPLGLGIGRGYTVDYSGIYEMHNGYLSLLVETGVLGLLAFVWLVAHALAHFHRVRIFTERNVFGAEIELVYALTIAYILACCLLMYHGLLYRDRGFMLLLGLMSGLPTSNNVDTKQQGSVESAGRDERQKKTHVAG